MLLRWTSTLPPSRWSPSGQSQAQVHSDHFTGPTIQGPSRSTASTPSPSPNLPPSPYSAPVSSAPRGTGRGSENGQWRSWPFQQLWVVSSHSTPNLPRANTILCRAGCRRISRLWLPCSASESGVLQAPRADASCISQPVQPRPARQRCRVGRRRRRLAPSQADGPTIRATSIAQGKALYQSGISDNELGVGQSPLGCGADEV